MRRFALALVFALFLAVPAVAFDHWHHGTYPQVYGPTGQLYGPTQAHYQYQLQYGRPWHGYGGLSYPSGYGGSNFTFGSSSLGINGFGSLGAYPFGYGYSFGFPGLGYSSCGYSNFGGLNYYNGPIGGYPVFGNPYLGAYSNFNYFPTIVAPMSQPAWNGQPQIVVPGAQPVAKPQAPQIVEPLVKFSNPEAKRRSLRLQAQGDEWFVKQNFLQAYARYKQAASEAQDLGSPRFRMGLSLAAMGHFGSAVTELKRGLTLDPTWPTTGERLDEIYGDDNVLARDALLLKVAAWVREDIRDPDRLFLMGVLLHFNAETDKAHTFFQTADALAGSPAHVRAFLVKPVGVKPKVINPAGDGAAPRPMPPDDGAARVAKPQAARVAGVDQQPGSVIGRSPVFPKGRAADSPQSGPRLLPPDADHEH